MNLYLDDNITDRRLAAYLRKAGHAVTLPIDAGKSGATDARHLEYTIRNGLIVVTKDEHDFTELHDLVRASGGSHHPGIFLIFLLNDRKRDMKPHDIVRAIARLAAAGVPIVNEMHVLNNWC
jgi:predicted nuclease of predicted toxin-antitoxin system